MNRECPRVEQSILHNPPETHGNCLSAVLAGLLRIPIEDVPHFSDPRDFPGENWEAPVNEWLSQFGLAFVCGIRMNRRHIKGIGIKGLWHELAGRSPRDHKVHHACVGMDGELEWDPHPSQDGIHEDDIESFGFLIPLRPWEAARKS